MDMTLYALLRSYIDTNLSKGGKSAYEIAKDNGFQGTEQEWLKSLQGQSPYIGDNGNWYIGSADTGITASPLGEEYYSKADLLALTDEEILNICK